MANTIKIGKGRGKAAILAVSAENMAAETATIISNSISCQRPTEMNSGQQQQQMQLQRRAAKKKGSRINERKWKIERESE